MNNTTHSVKANEIEKKWYILDATDRPLGRVATEAAYQHLGIEYK